MNDNLKQPGSNDVRGLINAPLFEKKFSSDDIDHLVQLVLKDLGILPSLPLSPSSSHSQNDSNSEISTSSNLSTPEDKKATFAKMDQVSNDSNNSAVNVLRLTNKVITLEIIQQSCATLLKQNLNAQTIRLAWGAILTPSAKDELKKRGIRVVFESQHSQNNSQIENNPNKGHITYSNSNRFSHFDKKDSDRPPFLTNQMEINPVEVFASQPFVSQQQSDFQQNSKNSSKENDLRDSLSSNIKNDFVVVNHLSKSEGLPLSVLKWIENNTNLLIFDISCIIQTTEKLDELFQKNQEQRGMVLTHYAALASLLFNRHPTLRAIVGFSPDQVSRETLTMGANILILDPKQTNPFQLQQIVQRFITLGKVELPEMFRSKCR
ncbi:MAG: hypothetical protein Q4C95_00785 [Planctomycetia bacterium]|nr:hypothetical protein [Planctomycetia bacterium]